MAITAAGGWLLRLLRSPPDYLIGLPLIWCVALFVAVRTRLGGAPAWQAVAAGAGAVLLAFAALAVLGMMLLAFSSPRFSY